MTMALFESPLREVLEARQETPKQAAKDHMVTPLRYPGGKVWLAEVAEAWAATHGRRILVEGFAGGAAVGLYLMHRRAIARLFLLDLDSRVIQFWRTLLEDPTGHVRQVIRYIRNFTPDPGAVQQALALRDTTPANYAFAVLVQNRFAASGILDFGKGLRKSGYNNRGLESMWYPDTLVARIERIMTFRGRVQTQVRDFYSLTVPDNAAVYLDPPYPAAGQRLYKWSAHSQKRLLRWLAENQGIPAMVSYEDVPAAPFRRAGVTTARIAMRSGKAEVKKELLAFSRHSTVLGELA